MVFGYLILISIWFFWYYFGVFSLVLVLIKKISRALKTVFDHISKYLKVCQIDTPVRINIFNSLLSIGKCDEAWSFMFDTAVLRKVVSQKCKSCKHDNVESYYG